MAERGLMQPGPTLYEAEQLRKQKGSRGLLGAIGEPMAYAPNPIVSAIGGGLLGAQYLTGEKSPEEGAKSLSDMTAMAIGSRLPAPLRNIITYHGSPHKFDKFDSSKIGTGEGAQAYGHGLYLAENPAVAKEYAQTIKAPSGNFYFNGAAIPKASLKHGVADDIVNHGEVVAERNARANGPEFLRAFNELNGKVSGDKSNLYKVDLPDSAVAKMLDWDKPLSQQAPEAREALTKRLQSSPMFERWQQSGALDEAPAGTLMQNLMNGGDSHSRALLSDDLRAAGIPGIRYLDQGSRNMAALNVERGTYNNGAPRFTVNGPRGDVHFDTMKEAKEYISKNQAGATRNFVVFPGEEGLLSILERNGQPLLGSPAGKGLLGGPDVTAKEVAAIQDIPTVQKMRQAMDAVGEDNFRAAVDAQFKKYRPKTPDQEAMLVESIANQIMAKMGRQP
jgi:hypothetical protein